MLTLAFVILLAAGYVRAGSSTNASLSERPSEVQVLNADGLLQQKRGGRSESDEVAYWHDLAVKRLKLVGKREQRIVKLLKQLHRERTRHRSSRSFNGSISHRAGWLCIHSGEGAWDANTGNGYYGGLQAHYGWGGVPRMDLLSAEQQMAVAESEYRKSGYSHSWLAGQWPNTYPPCAGRF